MKCPPADFPEHIYLYKDAEGVEWCAKEKACYSPFSKEGVSCTAYCPSDKPYLDLAAGCYGDDAVKPDQCGAANPILIADGRKVQWEPTDLQLGADFALTRRYGTRHPDQNLAVVLPQSDTTKEAGAIRHVQPDGYRGTSQQAIQTSLMPAASEVLRGEWTFLDLPSLTFSGNKLFRRVGLDTDIFTQEPSGSYLSAQYDGRRVEPFQPVGWLYKPSPGIQELYDASGKLTARESQGRRIEFAYDDESRLYQVTTGNQWMHLFYDEAGRLERAETSNDFVTYGYDEQSRLISATHKDGRSRQYHYEDPRFSQALTGITDERGLRYVTWAYDDEGRAIESRHGDDDHFKFVFGDNQTTVTNPLGKDTIYHYLEQNGVKRLERVEGVPSNNCAGANREYTYYPNGAIHTQTDWQGNITRFAYNARGLVTQQTEAEGTPAQRITTTEWHPQYPWPTRITTATSITEYDYNDQGQRIATRVSQR
ncbi:RHS repeat protein [Corallincola luteus]|uniref:RHS repeat protein n=1 Tax=Corallincola luteus TaxID=1775177 RepID=UPI0013F49CCE|nr:RHS repeat protein [Corallincola luteus]